jgi:hypothetical protein
LLTLGINEKTVDMKNLIIACALAMSLSALASSPQIRLSGTVLVQEKQYKKIDVSAVDKAALEKIKKSYGTYTIKEAHKADDGEYKLVLNKDGVDLTATFTPAGDLIKIY